MPVEPQTVPAGSTRDSLLTDRRRVTMGDVDAAGILYFAAPYRWLEEAFTGWLKQTGHPLSELLRQRSGCPCVTSATSYSVPLVLDDDIDLSLRASSIGTTSFSVTVEAARCRDGALALRSTAWHVWCQFDGQVEAPVVVPVPLPDWLRKELAEAPLTHPVQTVHPPQSRG